jgi:hypothetical protein
MTFDVKTFKRVGYNMLRKHVKVEPALYYAAADELGILIMQDMPSLAPTTLAQSDAASGVSAAARDSCHAAEELHVNLCVGECLPNPGTNHHSGEQTSCRSTTPVLECREQGDSKPSLILSRK